MKGKYKNKKKRKKTPVKNHLVAVDARVEEKRPREEEHKSETTKSEGDMSSASKWWREPAHIIQTIGIGIGAIVAFVYIRQLCQMIEANKISRDSLQSVQRAFLVPRKPNVDRFLQTGNVPVWQINETWENVGSTQAVGVIQHTSASQDENMPDGDKFIGDTKDSQYLITYIGPKMTRDTDPIIAPDDFIPTVKNPTDVAVFTGHRYIWGWIYYRDAFPESKPHVSEFCEELIRVRPSPTPDSQKAMFRDCPRHNCADGDCDDFKTLVSVAERHLALGK